MDKVREGYLSAYCKCPIIEINGKKSIQERREEEIDEDVKLILNIHEKVKDADGTFLVKIAEFYAKCYRGKMTITQLRRIFNSVKELKETGSSEKSDLGFQLNMILVNFLYNAARHGFNKSFTCLIKSLISQTIVNLSNPDCFRRFKSFFEAFLAFSVYYDSLKQDENRKQNNK